MLCRLASTLTLVVALAASGCGDKEVPRTDGPTTSGVPAVATTFYPTTYFIQRIAGDKVRVVCPLPADADPIFWMPSDTDIAVYQGADLIVINGAGFEQWVAKVSLPPSRIVDTTRSLAKSLLHYEQASTHTHGPAGEHTHSGLDGHTWLDPVQALAQAEAIRTALTKLRPADADAFSRGFDALAVDLRALDEKLKALATGYGGQFIYASHPAYNYLARRYGLKVVNLDLDPETMPSDEVLGEVRRTLGEKPAKHLLWESEPQAAIAQRFQEDLGLESVTISPCEMLDDEARGRGEDFMSVMRRNVEELGPAVQGK